MSSLSLVFLFRTLCLICLTVFLSSCASQVKTYNTNTLYTTKQTTESIPLKTPAFFVKESNKTYNTIGTPTAKKNLHKEIITVDPFKPTIYFESQEFKTEKNTYTNLIYRIHFKEVPLNWHSINLTGGNNPGLLFIYTLNSKNQLLLITTVHTCGCYLAFFPTSYLDEKAFPNNWPEKSQYIYGYTLPSYLNLLENSSSDQIVFFIESEVHRISDIALQSSLDASQPHVAVTAQLQPMTALYQLPLGDTTTSFFELDGVRQGYVKNNSKILEKLLISWWAFDLQVGEDKAYSTFDTSDTVFYTSLKFWQRKASNLKDFPKFLKYWGWKL